MIAWACWLLLAPLWFVLDGWLAGRLPVRVDLGVGVCLAIGLLLRPAAAPALLVATAVGRALLEDGDLALHFLALGVPVAVLLPARALFDEQSWAVRAVAAALVAVALPRLTVVLAELAGQPAAPLPLEASGVVATALVMPAVARLLAAATPLRAFRAVRRRPEELT